jgi:isocitrate dehydrogenase kinase/phosphatase
MIPGQTETRGILSLGEHGENKGENHTKWDFELWRELNRLANLNYAIRCRIVQEALKMENENRWKRFDLDFLARLTCVQLGDLHELGQRDVYESVFNSVYRIGLREDFGG